MQMDLEQMLDRCYQGQWDVNDFDWSRKPRPMSKEKETRVCRYYANMAYIERLAGALFLSLSRRVDDPTVKAIYETFYIDELRHSHAASKLMDYFDLHHYEVYTPNQAMLKFIPYFVNSVDTLDPTFANAYILGGELILDIALLRSLNDYVDDELANEVVDKINQDESRHIAMDFFMTEYAPRHKMKRAQKSGDWWKDLAGVLAYGPPFFNEVFFRPMAMMDPTGERMKEVIKRQRRFYNRPEVRDNPMVRYFNNVAEFLEGSIGSKVGIVLEKGIRAISGIDFGWVHAASSKELYGEGAVDDGHTAIDEAEAMVN